MKNINWLAIIIEKGNLSLGRVSYWVVLFVASYMWIASIMVPESLLIVLMALLSYNLGKKSLDAFNAYSLLKNGKTEEGSGDDKVSP
jgi:hypothetical protein